MKYIFILLLVFSVGCGQVPKTQNPKVQVTLSDGQRIVGELSTTKLTLQSDLGELQFSTVDAGELGLVEGENIQQSENRIRLWLRNGSEFVGNWKKPSIEILMQLGGNKQQIQIPIAKLKRLQFQSEELWPSEAVFRIITNQGDDFFVDVTKTQMLFSNEMGNFAPFLSELVQLQKEDEKQWRIYLENGSVFLAKLQQEKLDLHLSMGPSRLAVPLDAIKRMNREILAKPSSFIHKTTDAIEDDAPVKENLYRSSGQFFSNEMQKNAKEESQILGN